jgi:3'(2'), 5'-bisphosphate nucleotidase
MQIFPTKMNWPDSSLPQQLLELAIGTARAASRAMLKEYDQNFTAKQKADGSPLTRADTKAHEVVFQSLSISGWPILSEEGIHIPYEERKKCSYLWLVDPLDGTKEFLQRNGEFTVNIALIHRHEPVLGVIAVPVSGDVYYAAAGNGAYVQRQGQTGRLPVGPPVNLSTPRLRVVTSRSHMDAETDCFIASLREPLILSRGSSLKFMMVAEGLADVYPRFSPTMEWDTAAAHAIIRETGRNLYIYGEGGEVQYNKADLRNPPFICY